MSDTLYITLDGETIELKATPSFVEKYPDLAVETSLWVTGDDDCSSDLAVFTYNREWGGDFDDEGNPVVLDGDDDGYPPDADHEDWYFDERVKLSWEQLDMLSNGRWSAVVGSQSFIPNSAELSRYYTYDSITISRTPPSGNTKRGPVADEEIR